MSSRKIRDEVMMMTIAVNSDPAQQAIYELRNENVKYAQAIEELQNKKDQLGKRTKANAAEFEALNKQIKENHESIRINKERIEEHRRALDVNQMSMNQLRKEAALLKRQLGELVPGGDLQKQKELEERLKAVNDRMSEVDISARNTSNSFRDLADKFNHYSGLFTAFLAVLVGFGVTAQQIIDRNNKMADAMSGVEKNVNMTRQEVEQLTRSFSDLDTRTKKIDLLKIAEEGGKLGVSKDNIKEFVKEVDKAVVALGDSWEGGADKIANSIGKITTLYSQTRNMPIADAIRDVGSALNELAADGAASEANIADFVTRIGSLPEKLKPTIADAMGLGAAFEESGINAERGGTAYATFVTIAAKNTEAFAKVMRLPLEQVKEMINSNPTEFFLKFSEGLKGMNATDLAATLEYLKLNDQYVKSIVGAASDNTDRFRKTLLLSNDAVKEGTSLQEEFNKVNNNAAAIWEKTQKKIAELFTSSTVASFINSSVEAFGKFIGAIEDSDGKVTSFRNGLLFLIKIVAVAIASMVSYNLVTGVYNTLLKTAAERVIGLTVVEKARNIVVTTATGFQTLYRAGLWLLAAAYSGVTGNTVAATFAMRGFTAAIAANPLGAVLALVTTVASAYLLFSNETEKALTSQERFNQVVSEGSMAATTHITDLEKLYKTATNVNIPFDERVKAVKKLKEEFPSYFAHINDEIILNGKAAKSYHELRAAIVSSARAKAAESELQTIQGNRMKRDEAWKKQYAQEVLELKKLQDETNKLEQMGKLGFYRKMEMMTRIDAQKKILQDLIDQRTAIKINDTKEDNVYIKAINDFNQIASPYLADTETPTPTATSNYFVPTDNKKDKSTTAAENRYQKQLDTILRWGDAAVDLARQIQLDIEDARIDAMDEGYEKEKAQLELLEQRRLAEIDKKKITQNEFNQLDEKIKAAKNEDRFLFEALKKSWIANNSNLDKLKLQEQEKFQLKLKTLKSKHDIEDVKEVNTQHEINVNLLKRKQNEELASWENFQQMKEGLRQYYSEEELKKISNWEEGKEAQQKIYRKKELDLQVAHLQNMVALYEGLDMSILTPEQQKQVLAFIEEAKNKMAEFKATQRDEGNKTEKKGSIKKLGNFGSTDILGMSIEDWDVFFTNIDTGTEKLQTLQAAVGILQNAFGQYYEYVKAQEQAQQRQVDVNAKRKEQSLKRMLDAGVINQEQYEQSVQELNKETEREKFKLEYEAAQRQRDYQVAQIIANTAQAIMNIWAQASPFAAPILTGFVSALGAMQLATVMSTPLPEAPGYEMGYGVNYDMKRAQDGKKFNVVRKPLRSGEVYRPTHFIAGEAGLEMVIDTPTYTRFRPEVKKILHNEIAYARGYEGGYYPYLSGGNNGANTDLVYIDTIERNTQAIKEFMSKTPKAYIVKDMESAKNMIEMQDEYNSYKNSANR